MKIKVDYDLCEANARCSAIAPEVFKVDEEDNLWVLQEEPPADLHDKVRRAVAACPKTALSIIED